MKKSIIYSTYSHYDEDGHRSRLVKPVKAEIIKHKGYIFGLYYDREPKEWKLIDVLSGMSITSNKKKSVAATRIEIPQVFEKYEEIVTKKMYKELVEEHFKISIPYIYKRRYDGPSEEEIEIAPGVYGTVRGDTLTFSLPYDPLEEFTIKLED